ncbi:MAG: histidinol-phosphate aminotransferase family protein [Lachnospiraceae bacterium]|nr:histidinol-phosphate aminotransferase family protein [Lachnospiraceae bacterium]
MYYVDENVKNCVRIFPEQGRYEYHRYDMNENPEGLPKDFVDSVLKEITPEFLATYPEPDRFLNKYARYIGADYENVLTTNGSDMAIRYLLEVFCERGKEVVTVTPSFEMYAVNCSILGLRHKAVSYREDLSINVDEIVDAVSEETDIVVLLNPNNPVGNAYTEEELERIIDKAKQCGAIVIIDEAYHYFYKKTFLPYALERSNVVVLRTFSKLFSLAACRLGIIISSPDIIGYVKKSRLTFEVNSLALLFAERLMDHPEVIDDLVKTADAGKKYAISRLSQEGYEVRDCRGNFILVKPKKAPKEVEKALREQDKILIKTYGNELLKDYIRISTGSEEAMEFFVDKFLLEDTVS